MINDQLMAVSTKVMWKVTFLISFISCNTIIVGLLFIIVLFGIRACVYCRVYQILENERERVRVIERRLIPDEKRLFLFLLFDQAIIGFIVVYHVVCFHNCIRCERVHTPTYTHTYVYTCL